MLDLLSFSEQPRRSGHCLELSYVYGAGDERALKKSVTEAALCAGPVTARLLEIWPAAISSAQHSAQRGGW